MRIFDLTQPKHAATICPPRTDYELGRGNPVRLDDKTPQFKAVFFCPSFLLGLNFSRAIHIMMGLFGQSLRLVAPSRDISTPFNPVANAVESFGVGNPTFRLGITA